MKQSWVLLGAMHSREEIQNKQTHAHESVAHSIELHERHGKETKRERERERERRKRKQNVYKLEMNSLYLEFTKEFR